jgi:hypothetical protein
MLSSSLNHSGQLLNKQKMDQGHKTIPQKSQATTPEHRSNASAPPSLKNHLNQQLDLPPTFLSQSPNQNNPNHQASFSPNP